MPSPRPSVTSPNVSTPGPTTEASCSQRVLDGLSLPQRVGQLFLLGLADDRLGAAEADAIRSQHFGSVWFIQTTTSGAQAVREVADQVQSLATRKTTGSVGFFVAANQEGGLIQALRGPGFSTIPSAVDQGQLEPSTLQRDAKQWGRELLAAGVNMNFAPVMDVVPPGTEDQNQPIGVLQREYGNDPETVAREGSAFLRGMTKALVATSAKHFPGLGRVIGNTDDTAGVVDDVTTSEDPFLEPFRADIDDRVPFVMVALATYTKIDPDHLAVFSPVVIQQLLRGKLGFDGVVLSDDLGETEAVADVAPADRAINFLQAGGDMIISKTLGPAEAMASALVAKARDDPRFASRVDGAARNVLEAKERAGLLPCGGD
ncbi:MAG TPA: glycoside hydrolase family 3 N-terminal domain-containing protein [Actinomycetota bacterium]|nr:glycoside hydrolase family 3 N-terminal domain-containing protein [Actinomycetota bacterium]